jgi:hypothetical protein
MITIFIVMHPPISDYITIPIIELHQLYYVEVSGMHNISIEAKQQISNSRTGLNYSSSCHMVIKSNVMHPSPSDYINIPITGYVNASKVFQC